MIHTSASRLILPAMLLVGACATNTGRVSTASTAHAALVVVPPTEPREQTADQQVQQVLNRLAFGPRPGDVAKVRAMGVDQWIALQLASDRIDDGAAERIVASYETLGKPTTELVAMYDRGQVAIRQEQKTQALLAAGVTRLRLRLLFLADGHLPASIHRHELRGRLPQRFI
jgi:hypothetical protein